MEIKIDKNSPSPAYVQIEEQIQEKIFSGELALGEQLPTERILSDHAGISRGTIKRAYDELSQKGILERRQGSGTFVSQNIELLAQSNMKKAEKIIDTMLSSLTDMHLSLGEMENLVNSKIQ